MKKFIVYCHTNQRNNKRYVGWTAKSIEQRWREHCRSAQEGSHCRFHKAIRKWGVSEDIWAHEILEVMTTEDSAKHAEKLWIAHRHTFAYDDGNLGYNETRGGDGKLGYCPTKEHRLRASIIAKRENLSIVTLNRMSCAQKNRTNRKHTKTTICNIMSARDGKHSKSVSQCDVNGNVLNTFSSVRKAARTTFCCPSGISRVLRGHQQSYAGFIWKYAS